MVDRDVLVKEGYMVDTKSRVSASVAMVGGVKSVKSSIIWHY